MATFNQVKYGSQGGDVTELQRLLNSKGNYNLNADGIFGAKTQAAVKDYQQKNGLAVDGIVGKNTWGALTGGTQSSNATPTSNNSGFKVSDQTATADQNRQALAAQKPGEFTYGAYEKSDAVKQAEALLQQQLANKPGAYQSQWQTQLDDTLNQILNREKFSYDLNGDALYQQYKDQYVNQGQQAMMDTMGQAQAMTGGYGNSYAQTAGQQTYQGYLQQLNDKVPELYQLALDQYNREGQDLYNQYGLYADRDNQDYDRYRDTILDYETELARLAEDARYHGEQDYGKYMDAYNMLYGQHRDAVGDWQNALNRADNDYWNQYSRDFGEYTDDRDYKYKVGRDAVEDEHWKASFDEGVRQANRDYDYRAERDSAADEKWKKEFYATTPGQSATSPALTNGFKEATKGGTPTVLNPWNSLISNLENATTEETQPTETEATKTFEQKLHKESEHDTIARHQWGSYKQYVAYQIENSGLTDSEKAYLISEYGIQESDLNYKNS